MYRQAEEKLSLDLTERLTHVSSRAVIRAVYKYSWLSASWAHGRAISLGPLVVVLGYTMCFGQLVVKGTTSGPEQSIAGRRPYPTLFFCHGTSNLPESGCSISLNPGGRQC